MKMSARRVHDFLEDTWIAFFGSVASIVSLAWFAYLEIKPSPWAVVAAVLLPLSFIVFLSASIYSIRVRQENRAFRECVKALHRINHDYRDTLCAIFRHTGHKPDLQHRDYATESERKTVKSVCQKIAKIYTGLTHSDCTVTVKLVTRLGEKMMCETYERSEENCRRDAGPIRQFEINTGANTAFDKAIMYTSEATSHFHSSDLMAENSYRNQRDHWADYYRSCIVVPIRSVYLDKIGSKDYSDDIGFLCVDTMSTYRLNNTWNVELLAAFADQMYNFICLMRGKYALQAVAANFSGTTPIVTVT